MLLDFFEALNEHGHSEATCKGILLAWVVSRANGQSGGFWHLKQKSMGKARTREGERCNVGVHVAEQGFVSQVAEAKDGLQVGHGVEGRGQPGGALGELLTCRFVVGRGAMSGGGEHAIPEGESITKGGRGGLIGKAGGMQGGEQKVPRAISGKHAAGAVGTVSGWRQPQQKKPTMRVAKIGHRASPVCLVAKSGAFGAGDGFAVFQQTWAASAMGDFCIELFPIGGHPGKTMLLPCDISSPILLLDASGPSLQCGLWRNSHWLSFASHEGEALETLFALVETVCRQGEVPIAQMGGFLFCEGPGSLLGLRLAAMAVNTWRCLPPLHEKPLWVYRSLAAAGRVLAASPNRVGDESGSIPPAAFGGTILMPFRGGLWNCSHLRDPSQAIVATGDLPQCPKPWFGLPQRRHKGIWPQEVQLLEYNLASCPEIFASSDGWLIQSGQACAFVPEIPQYARWDGERHRAPSSAQTQESV